MRADVQSFDIALARPLDTANGTVDHRDGFLVRVEDADARGVGEATPLPGWTESRETCGDALDEAAETLAADGPEAALAELADAPAARHGLSLALADMVARRTSVPLYRNLGADARVDAVRVNATVGDGPAAESADAARAAVDRGFDSVKVKVGARPVADDAARLDAVRAAVGGDVELRADANAAWSRERAVEAVERFARSGVAAVEQPLAASDLSGHAALRGNGVDVAVDESVVEAGVDAVLDTEAADVVVLKPMALGGVDRAREAALAAHDRGVEVVVTTTVDAVVARTGAVHLAASVPGVRACGLATGALLAGDLASDPAPVEGGEIRVPQGDGLGVEGAWSA